MRVKVFVHSPGDDVGVAVEDIEAGESVTAVVLEDDSELRLEVKERIPLGHKVALRDLHLGQKVVEYGVPIGITTSTIPAGCHVHVHNIRTLRWSFSRA